MSTVTATRTLSFHRKTLLAALQTLGHCVAPRGVKPILKTIKLQWSSDTCIMQATDLEIGLRLKVNANASESGDATLPYLDALKILMNMDSEDVLLSFEPERTTIANGSTFTLPASDDPDNFPEIPPFPSGPSFGVNAKTLGDMIARTAPFAAIDNSRYAINGTLWEFDANTHGVKLVATNGRQLAVASCIGVNAGSDSHVIPTKTMYLLQRLCKNAWENEVVACSFANNEASFAGPNWSLYTRLVDGRYPDYRQVFPTKSGPTAVFYVKGETTTKAGKKKALTAMENLAKTLKQVCASTTDDAHGCDLIFQSGTGDDPTDTCTFATVSAQIKLPCGFGNGNTTFKIRLNPKFLKELVAVLDKKATLTCQFVNADSPALFTDGTGYQHVIMPLTAGK